MPSDDRAILTLRNSARIASWLLVIEWRLHIGTILPDFACVGFIAVSTMHRDFDVLRDPVFWVVMAMGILPLAMVGAVLVWVTL